MSVIKFFRDRFSVLGKEYRIEKVEDMVVQYRYYKVNGGEKTVKGVKNIYAMFLFPANVPEYSYSGDLPDIRIELRYGSMSKLALATSISQTYHYTFPEFHLTTMEIDTSTNPAQVKAIDNRNFVGNDWLWSDPGTRKMLFVVKDRTVQGFLVEPSYSLKGKKIADILKYLQNLPPTTYMGNPSNDVKTDPQDFDNLQYVEVYMNGIEEAIIGEYDSKEV